MFTQRLRTYTNATRNEDGMTLLELILALAILLVVIAIAIPFILESKRNTELAFVKLKLDQNRIVVSDEIFYGGSPNGARARLLETENIKMVVQEIGDSGYQYELCGYDTNYGKEWGLIYNSINETTVEGVCW
ncbi:hypothetical protein CH252_05005 [Rhodococcus sp. 06-1477-1B]|nr:hypothetical protein CH252_05005 [Rhodococcus sp. 06-1477-1B]